MAAIRAATDGTPMGRAEVAQHWALSVDARHALGDEVDSAARRMSRVLSEIARLAAQPDGAATAAERYDLGGLLTQSPLDRLPPLVAETFAAFAAATPDGAEGAAWTSVCADVLAGYSDALSELALAAQETTLAAAISHRERAIEALQRTVEHRATHDPLTGLLNRAAFDELLRSMYLDRGHRALSVLVLDLDGFHRINDSYGHVVADQLLNAVGELLVGEAGGAAVISRYGGDEFTIAVHNGTVETDELAARLLEALTEPFELSAGSVTVDASVGIATAWPGVALSDSDLMHHANHALAEAKSAGGRRAARDDVRSDVDHDRNRRQLRERLEVAAALRHAATDDSLVLHYQPIVDTTTGRVVAFEGLVRWRYQGTLRRPAFFMDIAENSAMIVDIGHWVIDTALGDLARLRGAAGGADVTMSVNVSARQLRDPGLIDCVTSALERHQLPPSALWLELTETALIADVENAGETLTDLAQRGIRISLDDFGVGYSALSNLSSFPISIVKIDKSFVTALRGGDSLQERRRRIMLSSIQSMADDLGIDTVAEGVEDLDLHRRIRKTGCTYSQGWFHGIPQPWDRAFEWFGRGAGQA
ncbi:bifunctional diguanylate cyclase/phosphodiesterase [Tsukamurella sp. 8F]|uniref:putative bifunctional diguanylate cyclase/phosphodiesterase n=1 Tax=unclassified Tsukamurella TaxID=2633480 RepID=UPI0023B93CBE|nr:MULTISPECIES: bifunctional diguanylate cyclase/phosphodiesterase [unclassified Tsukamurella]MDF0531531.1 bifunctional diguanylate cyclase/phosphodiesterase [Tsukamurella sp. 8J]MDF0588857.1 bifunctional diguanylate cyclase/phosphodiesterase [Tsukamurella sp. 8F]